MHSLGLKRMMNESLRKVLATDDLIVSQFCPRLFLYVWLPADHSTDPYSADPLVCGKLIFHPALWKCMEKLLQIFIYRHISVLVGHHEKLGFPPADLGLCKEAIGNKGYPLVSLYDKVTRLHGI